jgi:hypothetical protein
MGLFSRNPRERFWEWFGHNSGRLFRFEADRDAVFAELSGELARVSKGLTFEIGEEKAGQREFVVSADGIRELFPAVQKLVAAAPPLPGWTIVAFRQPKSLDFTIQLGEHELGADDVWFSAAPEGERVGLTLYVRGLTDDNRHLLGPAVFLLLDSAVGEYNVETKVGAIDSRPLPEDPAAQGLQPLPALRDLVK